MRKRTQKESALFFAERRRNLGIEFRRSFQCQQRAGVVASFRFALLISQRGKLVLVRIGSGCRENDMESWQKSWAVEQRPDVQSGAWVFKGTRIPVSALFENLRDGATVDEFLAWFPGVERRQVEAVLDAEVALAGACHP